MTNVYDFITVLHNMIDEYFPNTEKFIMSGGDYIKDVVMELREGNKTLRYSPYKLFHTSENYENTIESFLDLWKSICEND